MKGVDRREFLKLVGAGSSLALTRSLFGQAGDDQSVGTRPNVVFIYADDLDFDELGVYDAVEFPSFTGAKERGFTNDWVRGLAYSDPRMLTPNIDRLARDGAMYTRFYITSTLCAPSRYSLLTGQYASRSHVMANMFPADKPASIVNHHAMLDPKQWNIAKALNTGGYATGFVGKWHLGNPADPEQGFVRPPITDHLGRSPGGHDPADPEIAARVRQAYEDGCRYIRERHGFDYVAGVYQSNANGIGLPKELWDCHHNMEWVTASALKFIDENRNGPFFLYMAPTVPHGWYGKQTEKAFEEADPRATPEGLVDWHLGSQPSREDVMRRIAEAGIGKRNAMGTWLDDGVGAVLDKLRDLGIEDNTVVIFASDHQSRGKFTCYEGARVPFIVRWPGKVAAGSRCDEVCANIDIPATIMDICGVRPPADMSMDGSSFAAALSGGGHARRRDILLEMGYARAVVSGDWKYIAMRLPDEVKQGLTDEELHQVAIDGRLWKDPRTGKPKIPQGGHRSFPHYHDADQLFNLKADPYEQRNLAGEPGHEEKLAEMRQRLKRLLAPLSHPFGEFKEPANR